jgi:penicillin-binding protein 1C
MNPFPCELIENPLHAKIVKDRQENIIWASTNENQEWSLPIQLNKVSPWMIKAVLAAEDSRFYSHSGVDHLAVGRASLKALTSGKITSGASTLTMQLVKMAHLKGRSFSYKFRQMCEAVSLERKKDKEWILEKYLNLCPYGGNIIGIEAAARFYFRKTAADLNLLEASLLAGLPKSPSRLRPDRFPERAAERQKYVLQRMKEEGFIDEMPEITAYNIPDRRREDCRLGLSQENRNIAFMINRFGETRTTVDSKLQSRLTSLTRSYLQELAGVDSAAMVVIDNKTSEVISLISCSKTESDINFATNPRSSGSVLKPFIYLSLIEEGQLTPVSRLEDRKISFNGYSVRNFSGKFSGSVRLTEALTSSLNIPAVKALQNAGVSEVLAKLRAFGLTTLNRPAEEYGLSLALGGGEVSLLELTNAYSCLANSGVFSKWKILDSTERKSYAANPGAVDLLNQMLSSTAIGPGTAGKLAWKTGTSNGFRDAWCAAFNKEISLGVWLGNEKGQSAACLVGSKAAAPLIMKALIELYPSGLPMWKKSERVIDKEVCSISGLQPAGNCSKIISRTVKDLQLAVCRSCNHIANKERHSVISPVSGTYRTVNGMRLQLKSSIAGHWFVNGKYKGKGNMWCNFRKGTYTLKCISDNHSESVKITVQ